MISEAARGMRMSKMRGTLASSPNFPHLHAGSLISI